MGAGNTKEKKCGNNSEDTMSKCADSIETVVCRESDINENEMKAFELGNAGKVLLVKQQGKIYALANKCTHFGAPLHTGVLGKGRVRCPWHGACFNIKTGDIEDFPGLDSLPSFKVQIESNGDVKVLANCKDVSTSKRVRAMVKRDPKEKSTFLVVGGGAAGACCVETLRQEGFKGRLVLVTKEPALPYDRTKLSKALDLQVEKAQLRAADFYKNSDIEVLTSTELLSIDSGTKTAHLSSGPDIKFDSAFIAIGAVPRPLAVPGSNLNNVFVLRDIMQANEIKKQLNAEKHVVILGSSFIGMEVAAYCVDKVKSVTVIGRSSVAFQAVLGKAVGARLMDLHREKGVHFVSGVSIVELVPKETEKSCVGLAMLSNGESLPADIVLVATGVVFDTGVLKNLGLQLSEEGSILVDKYLQTNVAGIYAGGDVAKAPVFNTTASIGHWQLAHYHGRTAGCNMLGQQVVLRSVPFFWTMLFGKSIRYAGYAPNFDEVIVTGDLEDLKFVAFYCEGEDVAAIATCQRDPLAAKFAELLACGRRVTKTELHEDPLAWSH